MASKKIHVTIDGEEHVSDATTSADSALGGFTDKIPGYAKTIAGLTVAYQVVQAAIGKVRDVVVESFAAYDELATSQRKLEGTSKLTGLSLEYLNGIAAKGRAEFGLSRVEANDYATEVAKLAVKSGDASKATELLAGFLNIGAARGLSAAESLQRASQAILGVDEGTDALFSRNPSQLYKDYEAIIGKTAGKFDDMDKAAALAYAVLDGGQKTVGSYSSFLDSAQGKQALFNSQLQETKAKLGEVLQPLREFAVNSMGKLLESSGQGIAAVGALTRSLVAFLAALEPIAKPVLALGTVLLQVFAVGSEQIIIAIRSLAAKTAISVGSMIEAFGDLAERGGKFLKLLGIDVVADTGRRMKEFGEQMVQVNQNKLLQVEWDSAQFSARTVKLWEGWTVKNTKTVEEGMSGIEGAVTTATPKVEAAAGAMGAKIHDRLGKPLELAIGLTEGAVQRLGRAATDQLPTAQSEKFLTHMQGLVVASEEARQRITGVAAGTTTAATKTKDMAREVEGFARGAIDAATSFGVIDDAAARSLNSAVNIASALGNMAKSGFSFAGAVGVIGGVASIVSSMMANDAERRRLLRDNNAAIGKFSRDIGGLKLNVTGEDFGKAKTALGGLTFGGTMGSFGNDFSKLAEALAGNGLTVADLKKIGEELGIQLQDRNGNFSFEAVAQLQRQLGQVSPGRLGMGFQDQLRFFQDSQLVANNTGVGAIGGMLDFLRNVGGVTALDGLDVRDPAALREALRGIFTQLNNGQGVGGLGKLTGSQFMDILLQLIGDIDGLDAGTGGGTITIPDGVGSGGGTTTVPVDSIQTVIGAMNANLGTILTAHTVIHERIAAGVESSAMSLTSIDTKMDRLILATGENGEALNVRFEALRRTAAANAGVGPVFS